MGHCSLHSLVTGRSHVLLTVWLRADTAARAPQWRWDAPSTEPTAMGDSECRIIEVVQTPAFLTCLSYTLARLASNKSYAKAVLPWLQVCMRGRVTRPSATTAVRHRSTHGSLTIE